MQWIKNLPLPKLSVALALLSVLLLLIQIWSSQIDPHELYDYVGLSPHSLIKGRFWTLVTYAFFHHPTYWSHFIINSAMLLYYGGRITFFFGIIKTLNLLIAGVLVGGISHLLYSLIANEYEILIGISGGVFALLAAYATFAGDSRFCGIKGRYLPPALALLSILIILYPFLPFTILPQAIYDPISHISHSCHLGGLLAGWFLASRMIRIPSR